MRSIRIGSRGSKLALWQAHYIQERLENECGIESTIHIIKTQGDKILDVPLAKIGGKGLFTKELEEQLLARNIDIAVHSLKDVPVELPESLTLGCITEREDVRDCLVSYAYPQICDLPESGKVGTTSLRRSMQIKAMRSDIDCLSLRGNIQTRLQKLESGEFCAIILAYAGLKRLDITEIPHITPLSVDSMIPAMGQAALGVECREDDFWLIEALQKLHCYPTGLCVGAEREFVRVLEGGCQVPIGVHCSLLESVDSAAFSADELESKLVRIEAVIGLPDGSKMLRESITSTARQAQEAARELAHSLISKGAKDVLTQAQAFFG